MKKALVCPIDGVLNVRNSGELQHIKEQFPFRLHIEQLNHIINSTNCDLIIKSPWAKKWSIENLQTLFIACGFRHTIHHLVDEEPIEKNYQKYAVLHTEQSDVDNIVSIDPFHGLCPKTSNKAIELLLA
jgi:hypothetical protein